LIARFVPHSGCGLGLPDAFCKKTAILSKVPDLSSVVILERHRENKEEQGRWSTVGLGQWFLTFFTYLTLFVEQGYQIYPQYIQWW